MHSPDRTDVADQALRPRLVSFLRTRLTEELAAVWARGQAADAHTRPGMAAQVAVLDDQLSRLAAGRLPRRGELRLLLFGYGLHPDYEPGWSDLLEHAEP
jgi:hypothetical protein